MAATETEIDDRYYDRRIREMAAHSPCRQPFKAKKLADRKEDDEKLKEAKGHA